MKPIEECILELTANDNKLPLLLAVDDDDITRDLAELALMGVFHVQGVESGEACLKALESHKADLVLLDVEMPGINGYETCRRIKGGDHADTPVIFLSSHDAIEDRLMGYEAGGDDYMVKPFEPDELKSKAINLLRMRRAHEQQKEMACFASKTAMTAMTSLGEMGVLIETMKRFNGSNTLRTLAEAGLEGLALYGLSGAIQIRTPAETLTCTEEGDAPPLVTSVVNHMMTMDRISSFKSRMCVTYEWVTLLVNNMPEDDPERYGRLRDHLAMMAEGANVRVQAIMMTSALDMVVKDLTKTLAEIDEGQRQSCASINLAINNLNDSIARAFLSLGLTESQEDFLARLIRENVDSILAAESCGLDVQDRMSALIQELKGLGNKQ